MTDNPAKDIIQRRAMLICIVIAYIGCFQWIYIHYLYPIFGYFGYDFNVPATAQVFLAWFLAVLPSLWMPIELTRPSQLIYWILYLTVVIPSMFVPMYAGLDSPGEITVLMIALCLGFAVAGLSYLFPLLPLRFYQVSNRSFWLGLATLAGLLLTWMVAVFHGHMQLVSFENVYDLRQSAGDIVDQSSANYSYMWLSGAISPFLMGWGLFYKRRWIFILGVAGQVLVYSTLAAKSCLLSILFTIAFYFLFKIRRTAFALKFCLVGLLVIGISCVSYSVAGENPSALHLLFLAVVVQRMLSSGGLATAQYYDFFQRNPLTYLSHVKGISWFVHYPYKYPIGQEIGLAYSGTTDLDATAHFWATDGLEAFGVPGILFVSLLCALLFLVLDSVAQKHDVRLTALLICFAGLNLANASIFTSLLSGGLALLMLFIYFMPGTADQKFGLAVKPIRVDGEAQ
ncbi:MAG: hypothetical protein WAN12_12000 [Candidatus Acidiferrum sp.]